MKIALVCSSKQGMQKLWERLYSEDKEEEPPPDLLAECDSEETIQAIIDALEIKHKVIRVEADDFVVENLKQIQPDLVFNIAEGLFGPNRESVIPSICELLNLHYTGSDPLTLGICLDKARTKEILAFYQISVPEFRVIFPETTFVNFDFPFPVIVKPLYEGSSKGVRNNSVVNDPESLGEALKFIFENYHQPALVERFLSGREFTVGVLGNYPELEILPVIEIDHNALPVGANPIYSYEAKWVWDTPERPLSIFRCPALLSPDLEEKIKTITTEAIRLLRIRDWCRVDIRCDELSNPYILEINPLPGILPNPEENSCLPKAARAAGYSYAQLINRVVEEALKRYRLAKFRKRKFTPD